MAKMTRKTETTTAAKPAARRKTTAAPAAGAEKATTRRRVKTKVEAEHVLDAADSRPPAAQWAAQASPAAEPTHDEVAVRAWAIYERRGGNHGDAAADWFQAMTELRRERGLE